VREKTLNALHHLFATRAELGRADFKTMTGQGDRVASATISALPRRGFVASDSPMRPAVARGAAPCAALLLSGAVARSGTR